MKAKNIILTGMPGSGKSTAGKFLAGELGLPFLDLDAVIEQEEGLPIPEIFGGKGETYFRELEARCLRKVLEGPSGKVLATGGGAPCFHKNMEVILEKGLSVYLEVPFEELAKRLFAEGVEKRPLLGGLSNSAALVSLLEEKFAYRIPFYKKADLHFLNSAENSPEGLLKEVQVRIKQK